MALAVAAYAQTGRDLRVQKIAPQTLPDQRTRWALVIGVSSYPNVPPNLQLRYAHRDAAEFARFLQSQQGGNLSASHIRLLTQEQATLGAIRAAVHDWLVPSAKPEDIVYLFFAGHGVLDAHNNGYFAAHDSDPQNLHATALSFAELNGVLRTSLQASIVVLFADACHAGGIGWADDPAEPSRANEALASLGSDRSILKILASRPSEQSFEDVRWGGGHGVFTYALLNGLRGKAERDRDGVVRVSELIEYVSSLVPGETAARQNPRVAGNFEARIPLALVRPKQTLPAPVDLTASVSLRKLHSLSQNNQVVDPGGAWDHYRAAEFPPEETALARELIAAALENTGQLCVNDYVQSTASGLRSLLLDQSVLAYERLRILRPNDSQLEAKQTFCRGRAQIARGEFQDAVRSLQESLRIDSEFACAHNALGVAYLRLRRLDDARQAFEKAAELTPQWGLPFLQLAQLHMAGGRIKDAIPHLEKAVRYNPKSIASHWLLARACRLGKMSNEFERAIRSLLALDPNYAPAYLELAAYLEGQRDFSRAAQAYEAYLTLAPNFESSAAIHERAERARKLASRPTPSLRR